MENLYQFATIVEKIFWDRLSGNDIIYEKILWNNFLFVLVLIEKIYQKINSTF